MLIVRLTPFYLFLTFTLLISIASHGQNKTDTLKAYQHYLIGDSLLNSRDYKLALLKFEKSAELYLQASYFDGRIKALNKMTICLSSNQQLRESLLLAEQAVEEGKKYFAEDKSFVATSYYRAGLAAFELSEYDKAVTYHLEGLEMRERLFGEDHESIASSLNMLGIVNGYSKRYDEAIEYYQKALTIYKNLYGEGHAKSARTINNIGIVYSQMHDFKRSLLYKQKALELRIKEHGEVNGEVADSYNNIGVDHYYRGDLELALEAFEKSLNIRRTILGENNLAIMSSYRNLSTLYVAQGDFQRALDNAIKGHNIIEALFEKEHISRANSYTSLAHAYRGLKDYEKSLEYHRKATAIQKANHPKKQPSYSAYYNLGIDHALNKDYDSALYYYRLSELSPTRPPFDANELVFLYTNVSSIYRGGKKDIPKAVEYQRKALRTYQTLSDTTLAELSLTWYQFSQLYMDRKLYDSALYCVQKSLNINSNNFNSLAIEDNPDLDTYNPRRNEYLLKALYIKSHLLKTRYDEIKDIKDLKLSLETIKIADQFALRSRHSYMRYDDKIVQEEYLDNIYELALEIVLEMDKLSETREYQIMAFDFMERSKEANLLLNISNRNAKRYGKVPNDLLNLERTLKIDITNFQEQLNSLQATQSTDSARLSSLSNSLLDDKLRLDSVINVMEKQFPHYYDLKYNTKTLSLTDIQNKLQKNQVLLEYFDGDSTIYVCAINRNDYLIHQFQKDSAYRQSLKLFGDYFSNYGNQDKPDEKEVFGSAYQLYHYLIEQVNEVIPTSVDHLIVVPDAQLSMFPWSLFLKHPFKEQSTGFRDQHYLIKDHAMSYAYSSSTLFADKTSSNSSNAGLLAFAPSYSDQTINSYLPSIKNEMRGALSGLPYNNQELESIEAYFEGDYYFSDQASERNFKEKAGNSEVLHLAMHALVDHEDPMLSKLIFQNSTDSLEDGMLHTYELFNMEIPAKMVVLSACETGAGKIRDGEGVMSLGRAFSYAGCPSVVMSQWSINDRSTAELMASFYRYLSEGENKAQALRKAQLDFLDKAPEIRINPYFWGGFAVFGDPEPIGSNRHYWFWVLGIGLVLITILIFVRKRRKAAS